MNYPDTLRRMMDRLNTTQAGLAGFLGVSQPTVSRWINGKMEPDKDGHDLIEKKARELAILGRVEPSVNDTSGSHDFGEIMGSETVPVVGYVGAGAEAHFYDAGQGPFGEANMPPRGKTSLVAVVVRGDSMAGTVDDGSTVYYDDRRTPPSEDLIGRLCIVCLKDGRVLLKKLRQGRSAGRWDLYSANGPVMIDQVVEWAAKVLFIAPP